LLRLQGQGNLKCYIQANTHGGEIAGNGAIFSLLKKLPSYDIHGTIIIVPHCNPVSINMQIDDAQIGVYDAATGQNWNRMFQIPAATTSLDWRIDLAAFVGQHREDSWDRIKAAFRSEIKAALNRLEESSSVRGMDYRVHFALQLQKLSYDADFVMDLHTGDLAPRYLYSPAYALSSAIYFQIPNVLSMPNHFGGAFDEVNFCPWWMLLEELHAAGRTDIQLDVESYTVELGSLLSIDFDNMEKDAERILNYLKHKKMISGNAVLPKEPIYCSDMKDYVSYCAPASGLLIFPHQPGAFMKKGEIAGEILTMKNFEEIEKPERALTPIPLLEDGILITRRCSPIVYEGQELFKTMTHYKRIAP
jgi:predicted deacylase